MKRRRKLELTRRIKRRRSEQLKPQSDSSSHFMYANDNHEKNMKVTAGDAQFDLVIRMCNHLSNLMLIK
jgi:hypothetical protein